MSLIGIIAKKKDIQLIRNEIETDKIKIIEIKDESIENLKNIKFDEIIFMQDINLNQKTYKYMEEIISKVRFLIINGDMGMEGLNEVKIEKPIKLITFGFNQKATITVSSIKEDKIVICLQRNIEKEREKIIEVQEKEIEITKTRNKKIYNNLVVFIIKELHNL